MPIPPLEDLNIAVNWLRAHDSDADINNRLRAVADWLQAEIDRRERDAQLREHLKAAGIRPTSYNVAKLRHALPRT